MKYKILIVLLLMGSLNSVQAALASSCTLPEGMSQEVADFLAQTAENMNSIQEKLAKALEQAVAAEQRAQGAEAMVGQLVHDREQLTKRQSELLDDAAEMEAKFTVLEKLFDERDRIISKLQKEKEKAAQELAEASGQVKKYEDDLETSRRVAVDLRKQQDDLRKDTQKYEDRITELTAQLEDPSSFVGGARSRSKGRIISCHVTPETKLDFNVILKEIEAEKEEITKQLAQIQLQKAAVEAEYSSVSELLGTKDEEIAVLQKNLEKSQVAVSELQKFKEAEEQYGFAYVTEDDVPNADSLAVQLDELRAMGEKIANQITQGRLLNLIDRLRAMKAPWESKK